MDLKVGDIVRLKSGGPNMTVNKIGPIEGARHVNGMTTDEVETTWFRKSDGADDAWADTQVFSIAALEVVP